jgi:6-phosphogluconolactonase/glucosamine-6-phosphate isomerase/deaminase
MDVPWNSVHIVQVDARIAPPNDPDSQVLAVGFILTVVAEIECHR